MTTVMDEDGLTGIPWQEQNVDSDNSNDSETPTLHVSNPAVAIPRRDLEVYPDIVSSNQPEDIISRILRDVGLLSPNACHEDFVWQGFEQRKRVRRFVISSGDDDDGGGCGGGVTNDDAALPPSLRELWDKIRQTTTTMNTPAALTEIVVEEYPQNQLSRHLNQSKTQVTTFETPGICSDSSGFVALLPLTFSLIENVNRPKRREPNCWDLCAPAEQHSTSMLLPKGTLVVKRREYLNEWRSRVVKAVLEGGESRGSDNRIVLIKFYHLPKGQLPSQSTSNNGETMAQDFGYVRTEDHKQEERRRKSMEMPPLEDLLTILVTTSPIKSNPSTELLERVFDTFSHGGHDFAFMCRKIIICDGCRKRNESTSKRHTNAKQAMRNGIVDENQFDNYVEFKKNLRYLCQDALPDSPFFRSSVEELDERQGYGFALRHGLRELVKTPYVIVIQHDRTFMRPTPIVETVRAMWRHSNIKYVGMSMRSNLLYRDLFISQYGRSFMDEMASCILRPPELAVDPSMYGPESNSARRMDYGDNVKLRDNIAALMETYRGSQQYADHLEWMQTIGEKDSSKNQLSLTPTFFWYDNVHICETQHYRDFIFNPRFKMVVRGGFVEDKLSPVIKKTVERLGLTEGHARFGCFLLDDHSGMFFTGHLDGGSYLTWEGKQEWLSKRSSNDHANTNRSPGTTMPPLAKYAPVLPLPIADYRDWPLHRPAYSVFPSPLSVQASGCIIHSSDTSRHGIYKCQRTVAGQTGGFECTVQGDELFQVIRGRVTITDLSLSASTSNQQEPLQHVFEVGEGDVFYARNGRRVRWEFPDNGVYDSHEFVKVFFGFKEDGFCPKGGDHTTKSAEPDEMPEGKSDCNCPLLPMLHFPMDVDEIQTLEDWPFTNPASNYVLLQGDPKASGIILHQQSYQSGQATRMGIWKCTPGTFECTEQGDELMTVVKGRVKIRDVETGQSVDVSPRETIMLRHDGRRVIWEVPPDSDGGNGVVKIFYGSKAGGYSL